MGAEKNNEGVLCCVCTHVEAALWVPLLCRLEEPLAMHTRMWASKPCHMC